MNLSLPAYIYGARRTYILTYASYHAASAKFKFNGLLGNSHIPDFHACAYCGPYFGWDESLGGTSAALCRCQNLGWELALDILMAGRCLGQRLRVNGRQVQSKLRGSGWKARVQKGM